MWRMLRCVLCSLFSAVSFQLHRFVSALSAFGLVALPLRRGLTYRSTGPIAACRHLGYKSLAQMPARRNGPVSSNVRPRPHTQPKIKAKMQPSTSCAIPNIAFLANLWFAAHVAQCSLLGILRGVVPTASVRQRIKRLWLGRPSVTAWPNLSLNRTHCGVPSFGL